ncbi:MAG TPA: hypothetical protein VME46_13840 [Acidimicrobiales bacterium]|nr:hypothetical protein [Acidimicrobiales bacterium]
MAGFIDALRGYAFPVHRGDGIRCRYCGLDRTDSFGKWLSLSWDHLLPKGRPQRDDPDYIVTACMFCKAADNRYFEVAERRGLSFDGLTPRPTGRAGTPVPWKPPGAATRSSGSPRFALSPPLARTRDPVDGSDHPVGVWQRAG